MSTCPPCSRPARAAPTATTSSTTVGSTPSWARRSSSAGSSSGSRARGMGVILDVVPNHMCVIGSRNPWWNDVLENGPSSPFARHFDIDWSPPKPDLRRQGAAADPGRPVRAGARERRDPRRPRRGARSWLATTSTRLPLAPRSWPALLEPALRRLERQPRRVGSRRHGAREHHDRARASAAAQRDGPGAGAGAPAREGAHQAPGRGA